MSGIEPNNSNYIQKKGWNEFIKKLWKKPKTEETGEVPNNTAVYAVMLPKGSELLGKKEEKTDPEMVAMYAVLLPEEDGDKFEPKNVENFWEKLRQILEEMFGIKTKYDVAETDSKNDSE